MLVLDLQLKLKNIRDKLYFQVPAERMYYNPSYKDSLFMKYLE